MVPTAVIDVVGLTASLLGKDTPHLNELRASGAMTFINTVTPAVTCSVQATFVTGLPPSRHGIVGNGWYFCELAQIWFWRQANQLISGERVWDAGRRRNPEFTCAKMFWWYNMYSSADYSVTPRPLYPADGRKIPDIYSFPEDLGNRLKSSIGEFPFFNFWGPQANIKSSRWIADASICVDKWFSPTLLLIYLPHLDYNLQRLGPKHPNIGEDLRQIDEVCGKLIEHFRKNGRRIIVLSEYGITQVTGPIHINRVLRKAGMLRVRPELGLEVLDAGASDAFAVADHQLAHVYVRNTSKLREIVQLLEQIDGVEVVLDDKGKKHIGLDHPRSGDLVAISKPDRWFTYYYWLDDALAPDFARTVDIHRKPGYDPAELFVDPKIAIPPIKIGKILLKKKLGFRYLMDVIPLDATLVKGSHGRITDRREDGPLVIASDKTLLRNDPVSAEDVKDLILTSIFSA
jgi:predicted AlkP superfamily pyrophosphatase or phosphodiesterase